MFFLKNNYLAAIMMLTTSMATYALIEVVDSRVQNESIYQIELPKKYFLKIYIPIVKGIDTDILINESKALIEKRKYKEAYTLLKRGEFDNSGNVDFNYQLGVASLRSGRYKDAINAFDRVGDEEPSHLGSKLDLAIAYYYLGNLPVAKKEFEVLYDIQVVPAGVKQTIKAYLTKIDLESENNGKPLRVSASVRAGYSSNINSGYDGDYIYIPILNAQSKLSDDSKMQGSSFVETTVGVSKGLDIAKSASVSSDLKFSKKIYSANKNLDQSNISIGISGKYKIGESEVELKKDYLSSSLGGNPNYSTDTNKVIFTTRPDKTKKFSAAMGIADTDFSRDEAKVNNSKGSSLELSASDLIFGDVGVGMNYIHNSKKMDDKTAANGDSESTDIKLSLRKRIFGTVANFSLGYRGEEYSNENPMFEKVRKDNTTSIAVGAEKIFPNGKAIDLSIGYDDTGSNIELYNADNITTSIGYRRSF